MNDREMRHYQDYIESWERYTHAEKINKRVYDLVTQVQFNKKIMCSKYFRPTATDLKQHKKRFESLYNNIVRCEDELILIDLAYNKKRIETIKQSILKLKNYENQGTSNEV